MAARAPKTKVALPVGSGLLLAFAGLVVLVSATAWAIAQWQTRSLVSEHSRLMTRAAELLTADLLRDIFNPVQRSLLSDRGRILRGQVRRYDADSLVATFLPDLEQLPQSGSMMVGDESGYQFLIMRYDDAALASPLLDAVRAELPAPDPEHPQYFTRDFRPAQWGASSLWTLLAPDGKSPVRQWRLDLRDYDPRSRPWFNVALANYRDEGGLRPSSRDAAAVSWTDPYPLFTTKTPGISASLAARGTDGEIVVVAYDVLLDELSAFTRAQRPSANGIVFVFDDAGRLVGLPAHPRFESADERLRALLQPVAERDLPLVGSAIGAWRRGDFDHPRQLRLNAGGVGPFWASISRVALGTQRSLWIGVAVPESDLLDSVKRSERLVLALAVAALAAAALLAATLAGRFARPLRQLAEHSRRIARLDLAPQARPSTRIREINQLAASLETMRVALASHLADRAADQATLRANEQRFRRLVENASDPIVLFDLTGRIVDFNPAACAESGWTPEELAGANVADLAPSWPGPSPGRLGKELQPETPATVRTNLRRKDGEEFPAEVRIVRVDADAEHPLLLGMARDVSLRERLALEARHTQKMAAVGRLAGGVAHDFNNLLTVILGYGESVRAGLPPEDPLRSEVDVILDTSQRAATMTQQLLALSRRQITAPRVLDLREEVPGIAKTLLRLLGEDIELELTIDDSTSPVEIDPSELQQLLVNLAANSRDAMPQGGRLTLESRDVAGSSDGDAPGAREVELVLRDNGAGVPVDLLDKIFEPFFTTKEAGKGTGLGLATCAAIVDRAGGRIWATSPAEGGTAFVVRLPAVRRPSTRPETPKPIGAVDLAESLVTVLLVEDEPGVRAVAERVLRDKGFELIVAVDGTDALARYEALGRPIGLLVTDVVMPRMGGAELALRLRERQSDLRILFISGYADHETVQDLVKRGAAFLPKPFSPHGLVRAVRDALVSGATPAAG